MRSALSPRIATLLHRRTFPATRIPIVKMTTNPSSKTAGMEHFQTHASEYEKNVGVTATRLAADALSHLPLSSYNSSSHILDSAAGPGTVTKLLLSPSPPYVSVPGLPISPPPRVTAIDLIPAMVGEFNANKASLNWTTAEAYVEDSQDLSRFKDAGFDAVVMNLCMFALGNPAGAASEMYRVLKPGGYAVVTTWNVRRPTDVLQGALDAIRPNSGLRPLDVAPEWTTKEKPASVMEAGGFPSDQIEVFAASPNWQCESEDEIVRRFNSPMFTTNIFKGWSQEEIGRWSSEIRKQLNDWEKQTGTLEMTAWICVARKV